MSLTKDYTTKLRMALDRSLPAEVRVAFNSKFGGNSSIGLSLTRAKTPFDTTPETCYSCSSQENPIGLHRAADAVLINGWW